VVADESMTARTSDGTNERTALKEWAVLVDAMARGEIAAMVRKGGIREQRAGFSVRHDRFVLYPTFFHEKESDLAPRFLERLGESHDRRPDQGTIRLEYVADVLGSWSVSELDRLRAIDAEHGLAWSAVESRFNYKGKLGVQVIALRVSRLARPVVVPEIKRYQGCVSWVELDESVDVADVMPVLDDASVMMRLAALTNALG
jgi:hypothetical protein